MTRENTRVLIQKATALVEARLQERPDFRPLLSIKNQLNYLSDYIAGTVDGARLKDINVGLVAAREIEGWDDELAALLHQLAAKTRALQIAKTLTDH
jgi:hypothetical protein